jgi:ribonuclease HI
MIKQDKVTIYTDGAAKGNPGKAGWAAVFLLSQNSGEPRVLKEIGGHSEHATNNQMELTGPIEALKYLKKTNTQAMPVYEIEIVSDSKYVILGITEWIFNWQKNNWRNANKKPVLNREFWEELYELTEELKPKWIYVKGHNGDKYNERADVIATSFAEGEPVELRK